MQGTSSIGPFHESGARGPKDSSLARGVVASALYLRAERLEIPTRALALVKLNFTYHNTHLLSSAVTTSHRLRATVYHDALERFQSK